MSEDTAVTAETSITVDATNGKTVPDAPKTVTETAKASGEEKPHWLDGRLERERRSLLKELGIEDLETGKKALADYKAKVEAEKTAEQKATEYKAKADSAESKNAKLLEALEVMASERMSSLSEEQRAAVVAVAGDDPAKQIKTIGALAPTWGKAATATTKVADTAPARTAPDATNSSPPDVKAQYAALKSKNPVAAARFAVANGLFDE